VTSERAYAVASGLILLGVAMMCQPFTVALYSIGFPVILAGIVIFIVLDHRPDRAGTLDDPGEAS
jgi:hypothetical protein